MEWKLEHYKGVVWKMSFFEQEHRHCKQCNKVLREKDKVLDEYGLLQFPELCFECYEKQQSERKMKGFCVL